MYITHNMQDKLYCITIMDTMIQTRLTLHVSWRNTSMAASVRGDYTRTQGQPRLLNTYTRMNQGLPLVNPNHVILGYCLLFALFLWLCKLCYLLMVSFQAYDCWIVFNRIPRQPGRDSVYICTKTRTVEAFTTQVGFKYQRRYQHFSMHNVPSIA